MYNELVRNSRKEYKCESCKKVINTNHLKVSFSWLGRTYKTRVHNKKCLKLLETNLIESRRIINGSGKT